MNSLVSILIPVYNRENLVGETIRSAINQTYGNLEIIIVDNCSTDNTWKILQDYVSLDKRIRIFRNEKNIGPVRNWKKCIDRARGEYAKILFSDDLISENYIEETIKLFSGSVAFVLSSIQVFRGGKHHKLNDFRRKREFSTNEYLHNVLLFNHCAFPVSPGGAVFRTDDLIKSLEIDIPNSFDLDFQKYGAGNDLLLFLNTALNYSLVKVSTKATAFFRAHPGSFTIGNRLGDYYQCSKLYFIEKYKPELLPKFKAVTWCRMKRYHTYNKIYKSIEGDRDWLYVVNQIANRFKLKLQS